MISLTVQWFWLVKLSFILAILFSMYKTIKYKSRYWAITTLVLAMFTIVSPIKMETNTQSQQHQASMTIKQNKELAPKIEDNSFKQKAEANIGITQEDLK